MTTTRYFSHAVPVFLRTQALPLRPFAHPHTRAHAHIGARSPAHWQPSDGRCAAVAAHPMHTDRCCCTAAPPATVAAVGAASHPRPHRVFVFRKNVAVGRAVPACVAAKQQRWMNGADGHMVQLAAARLVRATITLPTKEEAL